VPFCVCPSRTGSSSVSSLPASSTDAALKPTGSHSRSVAHTHSHIHAYIQMHARTWDVKHGDTVPSVNFLRATLNSRVRSVAGENQHLSFMPYQVYHCCVVPWYDVHYALTDMLQHCKGLL